MGMPARVGSPPGMPVIDMPPPIPWATMSKAGRFGFGPVCPKPVTAQVTILGLTRARLSWSIPRRSVTPGLKLSNTTSACRTSSWNRSRPSVCLRSMQTLCLLRFNVMK